MMEPTPESSPRHLGLDLGEKRIGVAVSDPLSPATANPLATIERINDQQAVDEIAKLMDAYEIEVVVTGLPLNMDGSAGASAQRARSFIGRLRKARPRARYEFQDERLSSFAADEVMEEKDLPPERRKELRDRLAAMVILRDYFSRE